MGDDLLAPLLTSLLAADQRAAQRVVDDALSRGCSVDDVRFRLITPALHAVGDRWERGEIGVADEHLATSVCEWLLVRMAGRSPRAPASGRRALVGCSEGELHALGMRIVAGVLVDAGWSVLYLGAATPAGAWGPIVRARHPDLVVIGTTMTDALEPVRATLRAVKSARPECTDGDRRPGLRGRAGSGRPVRRRHRQRRRAGAGGPPGSRGAPEAQVESERIMCGARAPDTLTRMRRLAASILSLAVVALLATATVAIAQTSDDGPIQVDPPQVKTVPESSGFVDDQGNPVSRAEYNRIQDAETGLQWRQHHARRRGSGAGRGRGRHAGAFTALAPPPAELPAMTARFLLLLAGIAVLALAAPAGASAASFRSPSGNISCYIVADGVRCDIVRRDWEPPPKPASCEFDYGHGLMSAGKAAVASSAPATARSTTAANSTTAPRSPAAASAARACAAGSGA